MTRSKFTPLAKTLRRNMTKAERKLWRDLKHLKKSGFHFRRQAPIGNYIVDFVCHSHKLIVELDGGHHAENQQRDKDFERQAWLESQGYRVLRFWNDVVSESNDGVIRYIEAVLRDPTIDTPPRMMRNLCFLSVTLAEKKTKFDRPFQIFLPSP